MQDAETGQSGAEPVEIRVVDLHPAECAGKTVEDVRGWTIGGRQLFVRQHVIRLLSAAEQDVEPDAAGLLGVFGQNKAQGVRSTADVAPLDLG